MKSEITKGALYLFDDAFRERTTVMVRVTGAPSVCYLEKYKPFENGLAVLGEITKHPRQSGFDVCQLLFNNKNGIRYVYRNVLERARKISK